MTESNIHKGSKPRPRFDVQQRLHSLIFKRGRRTVTVLLALVVILWVLLPALRAVALVGNFSSRSNPSAASVDLPIQEVRFQATDGVHLVGWLAIASAHAPTILLVPGSRGTRASMLPWARFLYSAGYNIFTFDDRGCGHSDDWQITLGAKEPDDVVGAVQYLSQRGDLPVKQFGALGVSQGAGVVILAAAREPRLTAIVADSAWVDLQRQMDRMNSIPFGPISIPVLPYESTAVSALIDARLDTVRPVAVIGQIAPRAVLLIHSADDHNTLTPPSGEQQLFAAAKQPKDQWIAPSGGHVGALDAHPDDYISHVLAFFQRISPRHHPLRSSHEIRRTSSRTTR